MVFYFLVTLSVPAEPGALREPVAVGSEGLTTLSETIRQRLAGVRVADVQEWNAQHLMAGQKSESGALNGMALWLAKRPQHLVGLIFAWFICGVALGMALASLWERWGAGRRF
jgi:hypothetical protein